MHKELRVGDDAPWKQRYRAPRYIWTQMAWQSPARGLACGNASGVFQLYTWDVPTGTMRQLTNRPNGLASGVLSPDGAYVYYLEDKQGNEIGHYTRVPFAGGPPRDLTPDLPEYPSLFGLSISRSGSLGGFLLSNDQGTHLCLVDLREPPSETSKLIYSTGALAMGPELSYDGDLAVVASTEGASGLHFRLIAIDTRDGERIGELWDGDGNSVEPVGFAPLPGDHRLLATTTRSGVKRPLIWDARGGQRADLELKELEGEVEPVGWAPDARRVLLRQTSQAVHQFYVYDLASKRLTRLCHPGGAFWATYFTPDGEIFTQWEDSSSSTRLLVLDPDTGEQRRTLLETGDVPPSRPMRSFSFASSDGTPIQGWLGLPEGEGPFPLILDTHGGPTAVATEGYSPGAQAWIDHGFAFATINYRGSTTFGKAFEEQIWGNLGHWEVEDMAAARDWLVREGIAIPDKILLTGWSYGGYLTLLALGKRPELWAGGMAGIAIADWAALYQDAADTLKSYQVALFSGTPEQQPELYRAASPITYAEQVRAPVLIIQGRNDTRAPARPIQEYEARMRASGKDIQVHWFNAGHGSFDTEESVDHQERMLRFAYRVLG